MQIEVEPEPKLNYFHSPTLMFTYLMMWFLLQILMATSLLVFTSLARYTVEKDPDTRKTLSIIPGTNKLKREGKKKQSINDDLIHQSICY